MTQVARPRPKTAVNAHFRWRDILSLKMMGSGRRKMAMSVARCELEMT